MSNEEIIRAELEKIGEEAKEIYRASGKRVTGKWEEGVRVETSPNKGVLYSYAYLAGRGPTKNGNDGGPTLVQSIEQWLRNKWGAGAVQGRMTISSLAYVIARKIHREGTNKDYHLNVFEKVLTPQRIQDIINKVGEFNVGVFVRDAQIEFNKLANNV